MFLKKIKALTKANRVRAATAAPAIVRRSISEKLMQKIKIAVANPITKANRVRDATAAPAIVRREKIKNFFKYITALIMPSSCLICNKIIGSGYFCHEDFNKLHFLSKPNCAICGHFFEFEVAPNTICGFCAQKKPRYEKAISVLNYDDLSKKFILAFKYEDKTRLANFFAKLMYNAAQEIFVNADFITPVALHKNRLRKRKFNHSALIAKELTKISKIPVIYDLLIRQKDTKPQFSLNKLGRKRNINGAFKFNNKYLKQINGKNVIIIDDVITTGVTIDEYCRVLKRFKVGKIYVLTLAKATIQ